MSLEGAGTRAACFVFGDLYFWVLNTITQNHNRTILLSLTFLAFFAHSSRFKFSVDLFRPLQVQLKSKTEFCEKKRSQQFLGGCAGKTVLRCGGDLNSTGVKSLQVSFANTRVFFRPFNLPALLVTLNLSSFACFSLAACISLLHVHMQHPQNVSHARETVLLCQKLYFAELKITLNMRRKRLIGFDLVLFLFFFFSSVEIDCFILSQSFALLVPL